MPRAWLVLLALLLCLPDSAAARVSVPAPDRPESYLDDASSALPQGLVRAEGGLELLHGLHDRRGRSSGPLRHGGLEAGIALIPYARLASLRAAPAVAVCARHCERLLYYPTAPPSRR